MPCALLVCTLVACGQPDSPNLLLVTVDTLRADPLGCYGGEGDVGEALCSPAREGIRYEWAFSTAPYTVPAVASILSSRYPSDHRVSQFSMEPMDGALETVAELLSNAGYETAAFVSNPVLAARRNLGQGFDVYDDSMNRGELNRPGYAERSAADTTDAALAWLEEAKEPWFLWVHYQDPHGPYDPPGSAPATDPAGSEMLPILKSQSGYRGVPAYQALSDARSPVTYRERYIDEIRYLDGAVGRLLAVADTQARRPGILITADHGEALGEDDYYFAHGHSLALDQIRVPLIWRPPGGTEAQVSRVPASTLDVAPTLLASAEIERPTSWAGRVLAPPPSVEAGANIDPTTQPPRAIFAEHPSRAAVVAGDRYYARDSKDLSMGPRDPNSGGRLWPLPSRQARLGDETGAIPAYQEETTPDLEALLDAFGGERSLPAAGELDEATRARLEALGYLEK